MVKVAERALIAIASLLTALLSKRNSKLRTREI